jgi:Peptidase M50B-like
MAILTSAPMQEVGTLPAPAAVAVGVAALILVVMPGFWELVRQVNVMAHEGAHAVVGSCQGRRVRSVRLESSGDGETDLGPNPPLTSIVVGYVGPSGFGLAAAGFIAHGLIIHALWIGVVLLVILLLSVRNPFGITVVFVAGFLLLSVIRSGNAGVEAVVLYGLSWVLLLSGVRVVLKHGTKAVDARILRERTDFPRGMWYLLWLIGSVAALAWGATMLV